MPSPIDTLLRVQASPVPTQTFFGLEGSSAIAPIDCTGCSSKTGLKVVPPSVDFQTPPLAAPTNSVTLPDGSVYPARAEIRPLMLAEPMLRAPRPEIVPESIPVAPLATGAASAAKADPTRPDANTHVNAASSIRISVLLEPTGPRRRWRARRESGTGHRRRRHSLRLCRTAPSGAGWNPWGPIPVQTGSRHHSPFRNRRSR